MCVCVCAFAIEEYVCVVIDQTQERVCLVLGQKLYEDETTPEMARITLVASPEHGRWWAVMVVVVADAAVVVVVECVSCFLWNSDVGPLDDDDKTMDAAFVRGDWITLTW